KAIASSLLLVWMMQTATLVRAGAFVPMEDRRSFLDVVRNTKEANSILFEPTELTEAELTFPSEDAQIRDRLKDAFTAMASTLEDGDEACEPRILSRLQVALKNQALPAEPSAVRQSLLLLRKADLIDDVTLMPLL